MRIEAEDAFLLALNQRVRGQMVTQASLFASGLSLRNGPHSAWKFLYLFLSPDAHIVCIHVSKRCISQLPWSPFLSDTGYCEPRTKFRFCSWCIYTSLVAWIQNANPSENCLQVLETPFSTPQVEMYVSLSSLFMWWVDFCLTFVTFLGDCRAKVSMSNAFAFLMVT